MTLGWDQQTLARNASVAKSHLSLVERGKANASPEILGRLAAAMHCEIADLMPPDPIANSVLSAMSANDRIDENSEPEAASESVRRAS